MMTHDIQSAFSDLSPQQRVQTLESIRDYSIWDKVREEANKDIKECDKEINEKTQQINEMTGSYKTYEGLIKTTDEEIKLTMETGISLNGKEQLKIYEDEIKNYTEQLRNKKSELEDSQKIQLEDLSKYTEKLNELNKKHLELKSELDTKFKMDRDKLKADYQVKINSTKEEVVALKSKNQTISFEQRDLTRQSNEIQKWFDSPNCPTCGRPLERTEEEISTKKTKLQELKTNLDSLEKQTKENEDIIAKKELALIEINSKENEEEIKLESDYKIALDLLTNTHENNSKQTNEEYKKKQEDRKSVV